MFHDKKQAAAFADPATRLFKRTTLLRVLDLLQQRRVLGAVLVADRLSRLEERGLVGHHELNTGSFEFGLGLADVCIPQLALLELRLARNLL